jgi:uncharacterized membrane protein
VNEKSQFEREVERQIRRNERIIKRGRWEEKWIPILILIFGIALVVGFVLTRLQGICLKYWSTVGGETPPCWLPFGG